MNKIELDSSNETVRQCPRVAEDGETLFIEPTDEVIIRRRICTLMCEHIYNPGLRTCNRLDLRECPLHGAYHEHEGVDDPFIQIDVCGK